jgi:hypothetical protein
MGERVVIEFRVRPRGRRMTGRAIVREPGGGVVGILSPGEGSGVARKAVR